MLRRIVASERIHVSPSFAGEYVPRGTLRTFVSYSFHSGAVFFDGHRRPESRFFPFVLAFFPANAALIVAALSRPRLVPLFVAGLAGGAAAVAATAHRSHDKGAVVATLVPLWVVAFGARLWRGLTLAAAKRLSGSLTHAPSEAEDA